MPAVTVTLRVWFAVVLVVAQLVSRPHDSLKPAVETYQPADRITAAPDGTQALRISQVYGGGTAYPCDAIELFNATAQPVSLAGWSVHYSAAASPIWYQYNFAAVEIAGFGYFLFIGYCSSTTLPTEYDVQGRTLSLSSTDGRVALVSTTGKVTGPTDPGVVDFVGYGGASNFEGTKAAPKLSAVTSARRGGEGCTDTDDNAADFTAGTVALRSSKSLIHPCVDAAPTILSSTPANGATDVARNAAFKINFSEPVDLDPNWFEIRCDLTGTRGPAAATREGGPMNYTIVQNAEFYSDDACRMTIAADAVHDQDGTPDPLGEDYIIDFRTVPGECGSPAYPIHGVQGSAAVSPAEGLLRTLEGVVSADFQGAGALSGYFLQEEASEADGDPATSEGIFVDEHLASLGDVAAGSRVRVTGTVGEVDGMTSLTGATRMLTCAMPDPLAPADVALPLESANDWEQYEGMLVRFGDELTVADTSHLAAQGRLTLVRGPVPLYFSQQNDPNVTEYATWKDALALRTIVLDDGSVVENPDPIRYPPPGLSASNTLRAGDAVEPGLTGVVDGRAGAYAIQPAAAVTLASHSQRPPAPARVAGNVRVAFLSLNDYFNVTTGTGGPRGASSPQEFVRQRDKLVSALIDLDADVIAVSKLENDGFEPGGALADLAGGLNGVSGAGTFAFVDAGLPAWGSDPVAVGVLYRVSRLVPVGAPAILSTGAFSQESAPPVHRAPMAQTFEERNWGERFTVAVNDWHNRTDCPASGSDADAGDGQACWNAARTAAAAGLAGWLAADPTQSGDPDVLVLGELNSFAREAPIRWLTDSGYVDTLARHVGAGAVTTLLSGQAGYADHALASPSLALQVADASVWSINADEPAALDYQTENKSPAQQTTLYAPDPYRSSDRNPILIDLNLLPDPLGVDIVSFASQSEGRRVVLEWETISEQDLAGFDLHRARTSEGPWTRVNPVLIPANAPGAVAGGAYQYKDEPSGEGVWWHRLTAVDLNGEEAVIGLTQTRILAPTVVRLGSLSAGPAEAWLLAVPLVLAGLSVVLWLSRR